MVLQQLRATLIFLHQDIDALEFDVLLHRLLVRALTVHLCQLQALLLASCLLEIVELLDPLFSFQLNASLLDHLFFYWKTAVLDIFKQFKILLQIKTVLRFLEFLLFEVLDDAVDFLDDLLNVNALVRLGEEDELLLFELLIELNNCLIVCLFLIGVFDISFLINIDLLK